MSLLTLPGSYTDLYQLTMGQVYLHTHRQDERVVFDYFFRKLPYEGGYVIFAGLSDLLKALRDLAFSAEDLEFLRENGFEEKFIQHLQKFRFKGTIHASREGDVVFPTRPVLRVEAGLLEAQLIETLLLNILNFESLIATKASRMRLAAGNRILSEFGLRRAQGTGSFHASKASIIGGFDSTSNVFAASEFNLKVSGTMAHSFIQGYENELDAFRDYANSHPENCTLLVDTYDTLGSGLPNAIKVALEMRQNGHALSGIRLDSGDLAYLSKKARMMLDAAGLNEVKIVASNQLDEYVIRSLIHQSAPIDIFGVGTNLVTGAPDGALDGVYKLAFAGGQPRIKLSETIKKVTLPHIKQVFRMLDEDGKFYGADVVTLRDEHEISRMYDPFEPLKSLDLSRFRQVPQLVKVMEEGKILTGDLSVQEIAAFSKTRLAMLPDEFKRFDNPHVYKIGISQALHSLRMELTKTRRKHEVSKLSPR